MTAMIAPTSGPARAFGLPRWDGVQLNLQDVESVRLVLHGSSIVDWHQLHFTELAQVDDFLRLHGYDPDQAADRERMAYLLRESVGYLRRHFRFRFPPEVENPARFQDLFLYASERGGLNRRQVMSCVVLKTIHVINHLEVRELLARYAHSESDVLAYAKQKVRRLGQELEASGVPIVGFYGNTKSRDSIVTKLLSKKRVTASEILDRLRFRVVTDTRQNIMPVVAYLLRHVVPVTQVHPEESTNSLVDLSGWLRTHREEAPSEDQLQRDVDLTPETPPVNDFSGPTYRMLNFIADLPLRLDEIPGPAFDKQVSLGRVLHVPLEFQVVDQEAAYWNERGENSHAAYKERQKERVRQRLKWGALERPRAPLEGLTESAELPALDPRAFLSYSQLEAVDGEGFFDEPG